MQVESQPIYSDYWIFDEDLESNSKNTQIHPHKMERQRSANLTIARTPPLPTRINNLKIQQRPHRQKKSAPIYRVGGKENDSTQDMVEASRKLLLIYRREQKKKALQKQIIVEGAMPRIRKYGELKRKPFPKREIIKRGDEEDGKGSRESETTLNEAEPRSSYEKQRKTSSPIKVKFKAKDQPGYNFGAKISTWMKRLAVK